MNLIRWDPWNELKQLRTEIDRLWDEFLVKLSDSDSPTERIAFMPDVDVVETVSAYRLYVSAPGLIEEDIDLELSDQSLIIRGVRQPPYDPTQSQQTVHEWRYGYFERRVQFPHRIRVHEVLAEYDAGVLTVIAPKSTGNAE